MLPALLTAIFALASLSLAAPAPRARKAMAAPPKNYTLPPLPYDYDALEPYISEEIMVLHHDKHHAAYVNNLNAAIARLSTAIAENDVRGTVAAQSAINFNGGGHINRW